MPRVIETARLVLRPWQALDVDVAEKIYEATPVARWLTPELGSLGTSSALRATVLEWADEGTGSDRVGHWAVQRRDRPVVVGGVSLQYAPPGGETLTIAWALDPDAWGHGYAAEAGDALLRWAMHEGGAMEVFAVVQPDNMRAAATAERIGMEWVTELGHLARGRYQVYRIRHGDLAYED